MRNGQNKRMRGRNNHRKNHNPMVRVFESNGPDVKIRGNPSHIAEKYMQLARDAQTSGDPIAAENYYQHAEHYYRVIAVAQEQFRQNNPHLSRPENETPAGARDDVYEDGDDDGQPTMGGSGNRPSARGSRSPISLATRSRSRSTSSTSPSPNSSTTSTSRVPIRAIHPLTATSTGCRLSSPAGNRRSIRPISRTRRARTATTTSPTAFRCIAAGADIAARATKDRAVTAETAPPRAIEPSE